LTPEARGEVVVESAHADSFAGAPALFRPTAAPEPRRALRIVRRTFLAGLNLSLLGLAIGSFADDVAAGEPGATPLPGGAGLEPNVFIHIAPSGVVTLVCHRSEMGQGIRSSLPFLFADELGADMARVRVVQADGDKAYGDQNTDGSTSIRNRYEEYRRLAATARVLLVAAAAQRWKVPPSACSARSNQVTHTASGRTLSFGELAIAASTLRTPALAQVEPRPDSELQLIGRELPLLDAKAYVTGQAVFGADVRLEGMLTAVIARPPVVGGQVASFDAAAALAVPGVKHVIEMPVPQKPYRFQPWGGVAVVAENTWAALRGRKALAVQWNAGANAEYDSTEYAEQLTRVVRAPAKALRNVGDVDAALAKAAQRVEAEYYVPHLPHAPMEPPVAVARFVNGGEQCEVWAPTQNPQAARTEAARILGWPEDKVTVHVTFLGGAFGRKSKADFVSEAVFLAQKAKVPVRVQWTREDDVQHDYYNTVSKQQLVAGLDQNGKVVAWRHRTAFPPIGTVFGAAPEPSAGDLQQGVLDFGIAVPNLRAEAGGAPAHVRIGWLRSVYNIFHAFAENSFIDEIAHARGADMRDVLLELYGPARQIKSLEVLGVAEMRNYGAPLDKHPVDMGRQRRVVERVTEMSGWSRRKDEGRSLGLAAHRSFLSYTACVVSVERNERGQLKVDEAWIVIDAGRVINLDRVRSQLEGSVIFGMSLALHGGITMKDGAVQQSNFHDMKLVRIGDAPRKIHVDVIQSDGAPGGVGEPGLPPVAPALANAVFALTGQRVRELPMAKALAV
jgi:isoquinoline 1-oxidoreductase subunit beta